MSLTPVISVVVPTYNRASDLKRALASVRLQTFTNWEVLIVDNHSVDSTDQIVSDFNDPRIKLFKIHNNGVIAASRNVGIREATGEYVAFLDSDDWWEPKKLSLSFDELNSGADMVYHDLWLVTKTYQRLFLKKVTTRRLIAPVFDDLLTNGNGINNSSVVVRKNLLTSIGGLSEDRDLIAAEDYDCWLRIAKLTDKFVRIPRSLGFYWAGGGNISNPERTLQTSDAIELRYIDNRGKGFRGSAKWMHYSRGRAYFLMRNWGLAKKHLSNICWAGSPLKIYLKSQWMLQFIRWIDEAKPE